MSSVKERIAALQAKNSSPSPTSNHVGSKRLSTPLFSPKPVDKPSNTNEDVDVATLSVKEKLAMFSAGASKRPSSVPVSFKKDFTGLKIGESVETKKEVKEEVIKKTTNEKTKEIEKVIETKKEQEKEQEKEIEESKERTMSTESTNSTDNKRSSIRDRIALLSAAQETHGGRNKQTSEDINNISSLRPRVGSTGSADTNHNDTTDTTSTGNVVNKRWSVASSKAEDATNLEFVGKSDRPKVKDLAKQMKIPFGIAQKGLNSIPGRRTSETLVTVADGSALSSHSNCNKSNNADEDKDDITISETKTDADPTNATTTTHEQVDENSQVKTEDINLISSDDNDKNNSKVDDKENDEDEKEEEVAGTGTSRPVSMQVGAMGLPGLALPGLALPGLAQPAQKNTSTENTVDEMLTIPADLDLPPAPVSSIDTEPITVSDGTKEGEEGKSAEDVSFESAEDYPNDLPPPIPAMPPPDEMLEEITTPTASTTSTNDSAVSGGMEHAAMSRPTQQKQKRSRGKKSISAFKAEKESLWDD